MMEEPKLSNFKIRGPNLQNNKNRRPKLQLSLNIVCLEFVNSVGGNDDILIMKCLRDHSNGIASSPHLDIFSNNIIIIIVVDLKTFTFKMLNQQISIN
jgi:hypothetical protein